MRKGRRRAKTRTQSTTKEPLMERISDSLELPRTALSSSAHIELAGNREAFVDGCKGVLAYDDSCIRLNTGKLVVCFSGSELSISTLQMEQAVISGNIAEISFTT